MTDVPTSADDLRAKLIREFDGHPSEWINPNEFGGYDVDNASAADIALSVVEPELARLRETEENLRDLLVGWVRYGDRKKAERRQQQDALRAALGLDEFDRTRHIPQLIEKVAALRAEVSRLSGGNTPADAEEQIARCIADYWQGVRGVCEPDESDYGVAHAVHALITSPGWGSAVATPADTEAEPRAELDAWAPDWDDVPAPSSGGAEDTAAYEDAEDRETADAIVPVRQWQPGDVAYDRTRFVWVRYDAGWRTYPRTTGTQYGDALLEHEAGPLTRIPAVPEGTSRVGSLPAGYPPVPPA